MLYFFGFPFLGPEMTTTDAAPEIPSTDEPDMTTEGNKARSNTF